APGPGRDIVITLVAIALLGLFARGIVRSARWARRLGKIRATITLGIGAVVAAVLFTVPVWGSAILGRAATWPILFAGAPIPVIAVLAIAVGVGLLIIARLARLIAYVAAEQHGQ